MSADIEHEAVVVGGGPAGLAAALSLGLAGVDTLLLAPPHMVRLDKVGLGPDRRTAALFAGSIELLRNLGGWDAMGRDSEPITAIRIIDDTGALLRAPEVVFSAEEVGLEVFGWNVPNRALVEGLSAAIRRPGSRVTVIGTAGVAAVEVDGARARLTTQEGVRVDASLVAGADGRSSICRAAAGIGTKQWRYPQSAIATSFSHSRPHRNVSTEFHRPAGPFTTVPLPGQASSLVWVERPEEATRLAGLDDDAFKAELETRLMGLLGQVSTIGPRALFPLSGLTADRYGAKRVALIGEAAHVIPPIGAQGLNLGLRDAATLAECVARARAKGSDIGGEGVLASFSAARRLDIASRIYTVDVLNRSLISTLLPVHLARGLGLFALKSLGPLRRAVIREGLQPTRGVPLLMQPGGTQRLQEILPRLAPEAAA